LKNNLYGYQNVYYAIPNVYGGINTSFSCNDIRDLISNSAFNGADIMGASNLNACETTSKVLAMEGRPADRLAGDPTQGPGFSIMTPATNLVRDNIKSENQPSWILEIGWSIDD
jgi:hypothetical protein